MAKKVYTLEIDEKNLNTSVKAKAVEQKKNVAQSEVETYGIAQINNASASKKVKNNQDKGFEKVVSGNAKKSVKTELHKVDDYFDFSFTRTTEVVNEEADTLELLELINEILGSFEENINAVETQSAEVAIEKAEVKVAKTEKKATKAVKTAKKVTAKKTCAKKAVKTDSKTSTILKVESEHIEEIRNCQVQAEVCAYDDDAIYNIDIARIGSLFDCEKTMLN